MPSTRTLLAAVLIALAGCGGPSWTIRELGHPVFEPILGAQVRFERQDPDQIKQLDAYPDSVDFDADHRFGLAFKPTGDEAGLTFEVRAVPKGALRITDVAVAVFAATPQEAQNFEAFGELSSPESPLALETRVVEGEDGLRILALALPREALPAGTAWLAVPTLVRFADGWITIRFFKTVVPDVPRLPEGYDDAAGETPGALDGPDDPVEPSEPEPEEPDASSPGD